MESQTGESPKFRLNLFGSLELKSSPETSIDISAKKSKALLVILALSHDGTTTRDRVAGLLWSDTELTFAKTNLRQCLSALRKHIDNKSTEVIGTQADQISIDLTKIKIDVNELNLLELERDPRVALEMTKQMAHAGLLVDFPLVDPQFDHWLCSQRLQHLERYRRALERFLDDDSADEDTVKELAVELTLVEPENEKPHSWLINYYISHGNRMAALRQYELCRVALESHLDVTPSTETINLIESIRQQTHASSQNAADQNSQLQETPQRKTRKATSSKPEPALDSVKIPNRLPLLLGFTTGVLLILVVLRFAPITKPAYLTTATSHEPPAPLVIGRPAEQHSIAVIPFRNLNENQDDSYLSDGISEDLVTEISRVSGLNVIASQSSFHFRDRENNLEQLKQQLPVDYLLTGSIRRSFDQLRINVHLIRTNDNTYVWSDKLDRNMKDVLRIQDEITRHIVTSLSIELTESEWQRLSQHREVTPEAYDLLLRGLHPFSQFTEEGVSTARDYFLQSIAADPNYARPHANMALSFGREVVFQFAIPNPESIQTGLNFASKAEQLDPSLPQTQFARAVLHLANREHDNAIKAARKSVALDPNYADGFAVLAQTLAYKGELDAALEAVYQAKFLNPVVPFTYKWVEGHILYQLKRYKEAQAILEPVYESNPSFYVGLLTLTATYGRLGDTDSAEWINAEIQTHRSKFSAKSESENSPYLLKQQREHLRKGLIQAGLPE